MFSIAWYATYAALFALTVWHCRNDMRVEFREGVWGAFSSVFVRAWLLVPITGGFVLIGTFVWLAGLHPLWKLLTGQP